MSPGKLRRKILVDKVAWIRSMTDRLRALPLGSLEIFLEEDRNAAAAESFLRRALEALLDLGRHMLAKGFAIGALEYKAIATQLGSVGVLTADQVEMLRQMAGYRNRLTHFYEEISVEELYEICSTHLDEIDVVAQALMGWAREHPERLDQEL